MMKTLSGKRKKLAWKLETIYREFGVLEILEKAVIPLIVCNYFVALIAGII